MWRVLRPGGRLIASATHPFVDHLIQEPVRTADNERAPHGPRRSHAGQFLGALLEVEAEVNPVHPGPSVIEAGGR